MAEVVVLGAGITGLAVAQQCLAAGREVLVLDRAPEAGGLLGTLEIDGYRFDRAANTLSADSEMLDWLKGLGLENEILRPKPAAKRRYLFVGGRLVPVPTGPLQLLGTPLLSAKAKWGLLKETRLKPRDPAGDTVAQFFRRHFGDEITETFVKPFVAGIYAGDAERMGVEAAFARLADLERRHGSVIRGMMKRRPGSRRQTLSFVGGMSALVGALSTTLGRRLILGAEVVDVRRLMSSPSVQPPSAPSPPPVPPLAGQNVGYLDAESPVDGWEVAYKDPATGSRRAITCREIRVCLSAHAAADVFESEYPDIAGVLRTIEYSPVIQIFAGYRRDQLGVKPDGFGFLVPPKEGKSLLGVVWNSAVFEGRAPQGSEAFTLFAGGALGAAAVLGDPEGLAQRAVEEFQQVMIAQGRPEVLRTEVFRRGIPHPGVDHPQKITAIRQFEARNPGIRFHGNYIDGISMRELILSAGHSL